MQCAVGAESVPASTSVCVNEHTFCVDFGFYGLVLRFYEQKKKRKRGNGRGRQNSLLCVEGNVVDESVVTSVSPALSASKYIYVLLFFFFLTYCSFFPPFSRDRLCVFPRFSLLALRLSIRAAVVSLPRERMNGVSGPRAGKGGRHFFILKRLFFFFLDTWTQ